MKTRAGARRLASFNYNGIAMALIFAPPALTFLAALLGGFLAGSLPFSVWIGRRAAGVDVRQHGSRNPGAANVWRTAGRLFGTLAGLADAAKGAAAVWLAWRLGLSDELAVWVGTAAVVGHDFSVFLGFRGGKGGATMLGVLACFIFPELLVVLAIWILMSLLHPARKFLWSIIALSVSPILAAMTGRLPLPYFGAQPPRPAPVVAAAALLVALLWSRVGPGLRRPVA